MKSLFHRMFGLGSGTSSLYLLFGSIALYPVVTLYNTGLQNHDPAHLLELMITLPTTGSRSKASFPTKQKLLAIAV